jgi:hypothetical protein
MSGETRLLPQGFEDLERFVATWDQPDFNGRRAYRGGIPMEEIRDFYETMRHRADEALTLIGQHPFANMPEDVARLYRPVLALAHASMATEVHGAPRAPYAPYPDQLTVTRSFSVFA